MSLSDPDLRRVTSLLATLKPSSLLPLLPALTTHVLRSRDVLSRPSDQKLKANGTSSEASLLAHKLRTSVSSLLAGRSPESRMVGTVLAKAVVDVGGWEVLRTCEPWVRGLLGVLQKPDPPASKELAVTALVRILILVQPYQTLVREIVTPVLPTLLSTTLQLLNPPSTAAQPPLSLATILLDAVATLLPLHPATLRPFATPLRAILRRYLFPETDFLCSADLRRAARLVLVSLYLTAPKAGGADDWAGLFHTVIREAHSTADQVLRPVIEVWTSSHGHVPARRDFDSAPCGGSSASTGLIPPWTTLEVGARYLVIIFELLSTALLRPTKVAVFIPVGSLVELVVRVSLIARLEPRKQTWEQALETEPAASREERAKLWCALPGIHIAAMEVADALARRLGWNAMPIAGELLDAVVRMVRSGIDVEEVREIGYRVCGALAEAIGVGMSKQSVVSLEPLIVACCRDLQRAAGVPTESARAPVPEPKKNGVTNADLFLKSPPATASPTPISPALAQPHILAARALLTTLFAHLPQRHLRPATRALLERTAVLTRDKDAIAASVLSPYRDPAGRMGTSLLPFLFRGWPRAQEIEVLRTNLRESGKSWEGVHWEESTGGLNENEGERIREEKDDIEDNNVLHISATPRTSEWRSKHEVPSVADATVAAQSEPTQSNTETLLVSNPFKPRHQDLVSSPTPIPTLAPELPTNGTTPLKRRGEMADPRPMKRREMSPPEPIEQPLVPDVSNVSDVPDLPEVSVYSEPRVLGPSSSVVGMDVTERHESISGDADDADDTDDGTDESVHLNMEFEDDNDEGDEDDGADGNEG